jgi:hypothetical protein
MPTFRSRHVVVLGLSLASCEPTPPPTSGAPEPTKAPEATKGVEPVKAAEPGPAAPPAAPGPIVVKHDLEENGAPSPSFEAVVGDWYVGEADGLKGLWVDGTSWRHGTPSASLADQAKRLYGERYAEFLDNVKAFAFFPLAVYTGNVPPGDVRLSIQFHAEAGRIDQAAGIAWNIAPTAATGAHAPTRSRTTSCSSATSGASGRSCRRCAACRRRASSGTRSR